MLPDRASGPSFTALVGVLRLYAIDFAAMTVLAILAMLAVAAGFEIPANQFDGLELDAYWIAAIVIGSPLTEELIFRGWLSGRPGHVLATAILLGGAFVATQTDLASSAAAINYRAIGLGLATLVAAVAAIVLLRRRPPLRWFARGFPVIFWLVALAFAAIHLTNYTEGALWVLAPLVIPQFVVGTLLGYARVQFGLWAAILLHALHNGTAVAVVLLFGEMMPGAAGS